VIRVRERGKFWMREIYLEKLTYDELMNQITERYKDHKDKFPIYSIYNLWDPKRTPITTDSQVIHLFQDPIFKPPEIEIIFEDPRSLERYSYTQWWYKKHGTL
jgi:hypothetical protein